MAVADIQTSLNGGELSPQLYAQVDYTKFQSGAALVRNFTVDFRGGVSSRPGTEFIVAVKDSESTQRLVPFIVGEEASYVLEFGDQYIRFISNGVQLEASPGVPYEVATPYLAADLALLNWTQSADVMTIVHPSYAPATLTRTSDTTFAYALITVGPTVQPPVITGMRAPHSGPYNFGYLVTAVDLDGQEESIASNPGVKHSEGMDELNNRVIGLDWTAPSQPVSLYNVYKWGPIDAVTMVPATVWGFIGSAATVTFTDNNIAPDFSKQPPQWGDPFSGGQIQSIVVTAGGSGYDGVSGDWPVIPYVPLSITGDGTGAAGYAVIDHDNGVIIGAYLTNPGRNYTTATVTANGEGGTGATFALTFSDPAPIYPRCVSYIQQRQAFAGADLKPDTIVMSQTGLYTNFDTTSGVALDADSITLSLASLEVNTIKAMVPVSYGLLAFTTGNVFLINGGQPYAAITPANVAAQVQSNVGVNDLRPLLVNFDVVYGQAKGNRIRNLRFAWERQTFSGADITALAPHLFDDFHTVDWCYSEEPDKIIWAARDDGRLLSCTYVPDQEVYAWARHDTQGLFQSIASVPESDVDAVYVIARRHIPNSDGEPCWLNYIERLHERANCCLFDAWYLDSALQLPQTVPPIPIYLQGDTSAVGNEITITSYDPCLDTPAEGPFISSLEEFVMEAKENYDATRVAEIDGGAFTTSTYLDAQMLGMGYDAGARELVYCVIIDQPLKEGSAILATNTTGHDLWDGATAIVAGADFVAANNFNFYLARKNIDTGAVTFYTAYDPAATVPMAIYGDGTARRYVSDTAHHDQYYVQTDPRSSDAWVHQQSCELYVFRAADDWTMQISPLRPQGILTNPVLPIGMTDDWVYAQEIGTDLVDDPMANLYLVPRENTAAEVTADVKLVYATYEWPAGFAGYVGMRYFRTAEDSDGNFWVFSCNSTGAADYLLHKFTQPSAFVYPTPPVDGGFTDETPWAAGTGPNAESVDHTLTTPPGPGRLGAFFGSGRAQLNLISCEFADEFDGPYDDLNTKIVHTWFTPAAPAFGTTVIAQGYMSAAWAILPSATDAAFVITGKMWATNPYLDSDNFYDASTKYGFRWLYFEVYAVNAGVVDYDDLRIVMVKYTWRDETAPFPTTVIDEQGWDDSYTTYGAAISNPRVVEASINGQPLSFQVGFDVGVWDETEQAFWWGGRSPGDPMFQLDAAFSGRDTVTDCEPPLLKLTFGGGEDVVVEPGDVIQVLCGKFEVTEVLSSTTLLGEVTEPFDLTIPDDPDGTPIPVLAGDWKLTTPTDTVTGLGHLEGKEVWALVDGDVEGPLTVSGGSVTLSQAATNIVVGLRFTQQLQTLYYDAELWQGTGQSKRKLINAVTLRVDCTRGLRVGPNFDELEAVPDLVDPGDPPLFTGDARTIISGGWSEAGQVCVQQTDPVPAQINGIILEATPGDTGR